MKKLIYLLLFLVCCSICYSSTLTTFSDGSSSCNVTSNSVSDCGFQINDTMIVSSAFVNITGTASAGNCFQETANASHVTDGSCGLNYSGYYSIYNDSTRGYFESNYILPSVNISGAVWRVKHSSYDAYNINLPSDCINSTGIKVRMISYINPPIGSEVAFCYNGTNWNHIGYLTTTFTGNNWIANTSSLMYDGDWSTYVFADKVGSSNFQRWSNGNVAFGSNIFEEAIMWNTIQSIPDDVNFTLSNITYFNKSGSYEGTTKSGDFASSVVSGAINYFGISSDSYGLIDLRNLLITFNYQPVVSDISLIPSPAEDTDDLSYSFEITDADDFSFINMSRWYINGLYESSFDNQTTLSNLNISLNDNVTVGLRTNDGEIWSKWVNSSTLTIGDTTAPTISDFSLSSSSGVNDAPFTIEVDVADSGSVSSVTLEVEDPNSIKTNFTMSLLGGITYFKVYTPSTDGVYRFRVYALDGSSNGDFYDTVATYTDSTDSGETVIVTGGGGGSATIVKKDCSINWTPQDIVFNQFITFRTINFLNGESESLTPTYSLSNDNVKIISPASTILGNSTASIGLQVSTSYISSLSQDSTSELVLSFDLCNDILIPITVSKGVSFSDFALPFIDVNIFDYFSEPLGQTGSKLRDSASFLTVGSVFVLLLLFYLLVTFPRIAKSYSERKLLRLSVILIFSIPASGLITILIVNIVRGSI